MKTQNISNTPQNTNFQGNVIIVNDLSAVPTKLVRRSADKLKTMIADKNCDLFIRQNHSQHSISIIAQNPKYHGNFKKPHKETIIDQNSYFYEEAALNSIKEYEKLPLSLSEKIGKLFKKLQTKIQFEYDEFIKDLLG